MIFEKAAIQDISMLTDLRIAYLQEDLMVYIAKQLMTMMLEDAAVHDVSIIELKSTEAGYSLYKFVSFEDVITKHHNMKIVLR